MTKKELVGKSLFFGTLFVLLAASLQVVEFNSELSAPTLASSSLFDN